MKHLLLTLLSALFLLPAAAQTESAALQPALRFGYFSYREALRAMPEYAQAEKNINDIRVKYDAEQKRSEDEFNAKYEEFLDGQRDFAPSIRQKRQAELQQLMESNMQFRKEAQRLLDQARQDAYAPLKQKLKAELRRIAAERHLAFILNTDNDALPFADETLGEDLNAIVKEAVAKPAGQR